MLDAMSWPKDLSSRDSSIAENSSTNEMLDAAENSNTSVLSNLITKLLGEPGSWEPLDQNSDTERESALMIKMMIYMEMFATSEFCISFLDQMQTPIFQSKFMKVLGLERTMRMVIYGIGSIESNELSRMQMSLALLMKRKFEWIGDIEVFDPIMSLTDLRVIENLGCSVLSVNEHCRRKIVEPTLFFMPHCDLTMYENLLDENWSVDLLNHFIVLGNSFSDWIKDYYRFSGKNFRGFSEYVRMHKKVLAATSFAEEFESNTLCDESYYGANGKSTWHFFAPTEEEQLLLAEPDIMMQNIKMRWSQKNGRNIKMRWSQKNGRNIKMRRSRKNGRNRRSRKNGRQRRK